MNKTNKKLNVPIKTKKTPRSYKFKTVSYFAVSVAVMTILINLFWIFPYISTKDPSEILGKYILGEGVVPENIIIIFLLAFVWFVLAFFYIVVLRSLEELIVAMEQSTAGNYKSRIKSFSLKGEFKILGTLFNRMMDHVQLAHTTLDEKVQEKTREVKKQAERLKQQNLELQKSKDDLSHALKDLKSLNDNLKLEKIKTDSIISSMGSGLIATGKDGNIFIVNKGVEEILQKDKEEILGKPAFLVLDFFDVESGRISQEEGPHYRALRGEAGSADLNLRTKNGMMITTRNVFAPMKLGDEIVGAVSILEDVTEEKQTELALKEFVSLASHQLRSPLTVVNWHTEMLLADNDLNAKTKALAQEILTQNKRMQALVNSLLNLSKVDFGTLDILKEQINISSIVDGAIANNALCQKKKNIVVEKHVDENLSLIYSDPIMLSEIFENLLSNAIKYTPEGGKIVLEVRVDDGHLFVQIRDTGYGIPEKDKPQIFSRLFRASNAKLIDTDGNGLGLYIVKKIVIKLGGSIWFESQENQGTTFFIKIPI